MTGNKTRKGYGRTADGLILMKNGDVENFNPEIIRQAIEEMPKKGFYENHCVAKCGNDCNKRIL